MLPFSLVPREVLRSHILRKREVNASDVEYSCHSATETKHGIKKHGQQLEDVKIQIASLQQNLISLKEEKHSLFQQLKTVLNEEDEKRGKYEAHKHTPPTIVGLSEELRIV